jgi:hypothetical protein
MASEPGVRREFGRKRWSGVVAPSVLAAPLVDPTIAAQPAPSMPPVSNAPAERPASSVENRLFDVVDSVLGTDTNRSEQRGIGRNGGIGAGGLGQAVVETAVETATEKATEMAVKGVAAIAVGLLAGKFNPFGDH